MAEIYNEIEKPETPEKIDLEDLIIEVTRKCNMKCCHCLRGRSDDMDMPREYIENILSRICSIDVLTFTGGEPSLGINAMLETLRYCARYRIPVREVYIATNGKHVPEEFIEALRQWDMYCKESHVRDRINEYTGGTDAVKLVRWLTNDEDGHMGIRVDLSMDGYHEDIPIKNILALMTLPGTLGTGKYHKENDEDWLIRTGQAEWNGIGDYDSTTKRNWAYGDGAGEIELERWSNGQLHAAQLYISCDGSICKYCDYSYEDIEEYALGSAKDKNWLDAMIEKHLKKEGKQDNG